MNQNATFGPYTIRHELGSGGFSQVYAAYDQRRKLVALKLLGPGATASNEGRQRFLREVEAARRLSHRHVVPVYDSGIHSGRAFLAMRLMRGGTLADRLEQTPILDASAAAQVVRHTARALDHATRMGVIHRDVKPSNIFYHDKRTVCLGDFGLAKVHGLGTVTQLGQVIGTVYYMAPEQVKGLSYTTAYSDIYSLGVVLYQMLTGRLPFEGQLQQAVLDDIVNTSPTRPTRYDPAMSAEVERVILRALNKEPQQRYASAGQLAAAYEAAAGRNVWLMLTSRSIPPAAAGNPPRAGGPQATPPGTRRPATERFEFWLAILALMAFVLLVLYASG